MASRGVNKVILIGNLGNDPELRYGGSGKAIANVSLATSEAWKDKESGDQQEKTEWHRVVFFGRLAEIVSEYLNKGSKIYVEGRLQTRKWQDKDGNDKYSTEIVANEMQMLDSRGGSGGGMNESRANRDSSPSDTTSNQSTPRQPAGADDFDDDIPF